MYEHKCLRLRFVALLGVEFSDGRLPNLYLDIFLALSCQPMVANHVHEIVAPRVLRWSSSKLVTAFTTSLDIFFMLAIYENEIF